MQDSGNSSAADTASGAWAEAMRMGDFAAAWRIADAVLAARAGASRDDPALAYHLRWVWDGTPPDGLHVLVRCYHGLGDTLAFCRYLAPLRRRARRVTLEVQPELVPLLRGLPGIDQLVPFDVARPLPPAELDVEIMELAHALRLPPEQAALPDIRLAAADPAGATGAADPPAGRVALCWESGAWDPSRSLAGAALLGALGGQGPFVSLQRGPAAMQARAPWFLNPGDDDADVLRTARMIRAARRVVTVDTMVAHLAGLLGAPTYLLLRHEPDWRWHGGEGRSRWYPSLTMLRQEVQGDWSAPLAALRLAMASATPA